MRLALGLLLIFMIALTGCGTGPGTVVFMGDSLTAWWNLPQYFPAKNYVDKGIPGNTTAQMLARFNSDVIALHPQLVVVWGGTNSLGWVSNEQVEQELASMYGAAQQAGIQVVACTITPRRADGADPRDLTPEIQEVNAWIRQYAPAHDIQVADYYPALADSEGWLPKDLTVDFVHLNPAGYQIITPIAAASIANTFNGASQ